MAEEKTWLDIILHYGLFLGGIFQLIAILAIVFVPQKPSVEDNNIAEEKSRQEKPASQPINRRMKDTKKRR